MWSSSTMINLNELYFLFTFSPSSPDEGMVEGECSICPFSKSSIAAAVSLVSVSASNSIPPRSTSTAESADGTSAVEGIYINKHMDGSILFPSNKIIRLIVNFAWYLQSLHHEHLTDFYRLFFHLFGEFFWESTWRNWSLAGLMTGGTGSSLQSNSPPPVALAPSSCCSLPSATELSLKSFPADLQVPIGGSMGIAPSEWRRHSNMWQPQKQSAQLIHVSVKDNVMGIVAAWLRHSVTGQTPETKK